MGSISEGLEEGTAFQRRGDDPQCYKSYNTYKDGRYGKGLPPVSREESDGVGMGQLII